MALFRRVRIKTEIKVLAVEPRNEPSATHVDDDDPDDDLDSDPDDDPELLRMLEAEEESDWIAYSELQDELYNEAAVEDELNYRMMLDELPSDSDEENSESHDSDDSDDIEEDIDMDYRFS